MDGPLVWAQLVQQRLYGRPFGSTGAGWCKSSRLMQMEPFGAIGAGWFNGCRLIQQVPFESTRAVWGRLGSFGAPGAVWCNWGRLATAFVWAELVQQRVAQLQAEKCSSRYRTRDLPRSKMAHNQLSQLGLLCSGISLPYQPFT